MYVGELQVWILVAAGMSYLTLRGQLSVTERQVRQVSEVVGGLLSMFAWVVVAFGQLAVEPAGYAATPEQHVPAAAVAAVCAALMGIVGLFGTTKLVDIRDLVQDSRGAGVSGRPQEPTQRDRR